MWSTSDGDADINNLGPCGRPSYTSVQVTFFHIPATFGMLLANMSDLAGVNASRNGSVQLMCIFSTIF